MSFFMGYWCIKIVGGGLSPDCLEAFERSGDKPPPTAKSPSFRCSALGFYALVKEGFHFTNDFGVLII